MMPIQHLSPSRYQYDPPSSLARKIIGSDDPMKWFIKIENGIAIVCQQGEIKWLLPFYENARQIALSIGNELYKIGFEMILIGAHAYSNYKTQQLCTKHAILYNSEVSSSHWFNNTMYRKSVSNCGMVWSYSTLHMNQLRQLIGENAKLCWIPLLHAGVCWTNTYSAYEGGYPIDVCFVGAVHGCKKRMDFISALEDAKKEHGLHFVVCANLFGEQLQSILSETRFMVELGNYFDEIGGAVTQARIVEPIRNGMEVLADKTSGDTENIVGPTYMGVDEMIPYILSKRKNKPCLQYTPELQNQWNEIMETCLKEILK